MEKISEKFQEQLKTLMSHEVDRGMLSFTINMNGKNVTVTTEVK